MADQFAGRLEVETEKQGADRRRAPRVEKAYEVTYAVKALPDEKTLIETLDKLLVAQTSDLSTVGLSMWTNKLLIPGTTLELTFPVPPADKSVKVKARVVWCQPHTDGGYVRARMGLEFIEVDSEMTKRLMTLASGT